VHPIARALDMEVAMVHSRFVGAGRLFPESAGKFTAHFRDSAVEAVWK
jgi:hypothetical protein